MQAARGRRRPVVWVVAVVPLALCAGSARADNLVVDGTGTLGPATFVVGPATPRRYDHVCVINGGTLSVQPYAAAGDKHLVGNLELIAASVYVDASSKVSARGAGYSTPQCDAGTGPTATAGGRGGCAVRDSGGGGAHFGRGGRGTVDNPTQFPLHYEDDCDHHPSGNACDSYTDCGDPTSAAAHDRLGPSVAGLPYWHSVYDSEFGAAGGDKGCRDHDGFPPAPTVGGSGGGRIVLVGLTERLSSGGASSSPCGGLTAGEVRIDGTIDAGGNRGCGIENDSGGGGAGGTVLIVGDHVEVGAGALISAAGGLGGDTHSAAVGQPNYQDCVAGAQTTGTCDDCGGGGGGGLVSILSVTRKLDPASQFDVSGALGGTCDVCKGEAGGGAGELQLDGAYVGEFCDGYDNDFDGNVDEGLGEQSCGLGSCAMNISACASGAPVSCTPLVDASMPSCLASPEGAHPRVAVILDTSASMLLDLDGYPTFGDGSVDHPGLDTNGDSQPNDSRLFLAREALAQVMSAYPEIDFALARYHQNQALDRSCQTATWFECQNLVASYDNPADNTGPVSCTVQIGPNPGDTVTVHRDPVNHEECINYAGSCGPPRRGADILAGFGMPTRDSVRWLDGRETQFDPSDTPGNVCDHAHGGDCEVRATGPTPLAGSLFSLEDYIVPIRATDPATACRGYSIVLVTDGAESCNGDPAAEAQRLHDMFGVDVYVIAVSVLPEEQASLDAIAQAGSGNTRGATFVTAPEQLVPALTSIVAGSIRFELCNGLDDDCDGKIDEDFPGLGQACDDAGQGLCRGTGVLACSADHKSVACDITMAGASAGVESCNQLDDDCDGKVDEGLDCTNTPCTHTGVEVCNNQDDDCDGKIDESDPGENAECGSGDGVCKPGRTHCVNGMLQCVGATLPGAETCNGLDENCNGQIDDDAPCPPATACIQAACRRRCDPEIEFSCPLGMKCARFDQYDDWFCVPTPCAACTSDQSCIDDQCVDLCADVQCADGQRCVRGNCRDCHLLGCDQAGQVCFAGQCIDDPCAGVSCGADQTCANGQCQATCADRDCPAGQRCGANGRCTNNACGGIECVASTFCDQGKCRDNPCSQLQCLAGHVCVPALGCIDDPCPLARCPDGLACTVGAAGQAQCADPAHVTASGSGTKAAAAGAKHYVIAQGGGGFSCAARGAGSGSGPSGTFAWVLGALFYLAARRRSVR